VFGGIILERMGMNILNIWERIFSTNGPRMYRGTVTNSKAVNFTTPQFQRVLGTTIALLKDGPRN
jgi:hypothetical protein